MTYADDTCLLFSNYSWDYLHFKVIIDTKRVVDSDIFNISSVKRNYPLKYLLKNFFYDFQHQ